MNGLCAYMHQPDDVLHGSVKLMRNCALRSRCDRIRMSERLRTETKRTFRSHTRIYVFVTCAHGLAGMQFGLINRYEYRFSSAGRKRKKKMLRRRRIEGN